ncbi:MBL fold metallo-hydrolase, partial [Salmonella enterica subsp. enterica serovar Heidelberg]|nr:MBL fold metallo-hydrolase [Salmonella enterica subsp. enterica serovar Heidelberg]
ILPVHGEVRHMHEQSRFALSLGVPRAINQVNGEIWRLAPDGPERVGQAPAGRLVLDGDIILPADGTTINERRRISFHGQISAAVAIRQGRLAGAPQIRLQGVPVEEDREDFIAEACEAAAEAVKKDGRGDIEKLREAVRLAVRRAAFRYTGKKPIVDVLIIEA